MGGWASPLIPSGKRPLFYLHHPRNLDTPNMSYCWFMDPIYIYIISLVKHGNFMVFWWNNWIISHMIPWMYTMKSPCFTEVFVNKNCHSPADSQLLRATSSASSSMWTSLLLTSLPAARCQNRPTNPRLEPVNNVGLYGHGVPLNHSRF